MSFWRRSKVERVKNAQKSNGFPSKLEAAVYDMLLLRQRNLEITEVRRQQSVALQDGPREVKISMRVDFTYVDVKSGQTRAVEAKGYPTEVYRLKLKLWRKNPPMPLEVWGGHYARLRLLEKIEVNTP